MTRAEEWGIFDHIAKAAIIHCKIDVYKDRGAKAYTVLHCLYHSSVAYICAYVNF